MLAQVLLGQAWTQGLSSPRADRLMCRALSLGCLPGQPRGRALWGRAQPRLWL